MKKILSFLMMALFSVSMFAADPVTVKSVFTKATAPADSKVTDLDGKVTWSIATEVGQGEPTYTTGAASSVEAIKFGSSKSVYFKKVKFSTDYFKDYNVKSVSLYVKNNGAKIGTLTATQGEVTIGTKANESATSDWNVMTASGNTGKGGTVEVIYEVEQASYWSYIEVTYEEGEGGGEATHTYTVAGSSDVAFGTTWTPANTANDMVKQEDGTYKWEKTDLTLPAGVIEFKVCEDHDWKVAYPKDNYSLSILEAGVYTITITFNPAAESDKVAAQASKTGSAEIDPTAAIKGGWDGWANELALVLAGDKLTATGVLNIATAGDYEFKVLLNGSDWRSNGHTYHREYTGAEGITGNGDNMKLQADVAGEYTFTWTFATNALAITFPAAAEEPVEPKEVSGAIAWDFSKLVANTESALYNSDKEGILLTNETTPSKTDEIVYSEYAGELWTVGEGFDAASIAFTGEYPIRKNKMCQNGTLRFKTSVAGSIIVKFSDTGSSASATAVKRYLVVNGEQTEYWTSRENNGTENPYDAQLDVTTGAIAVAAGEVTIAGSSAIVVYSVEFAPASAPEPVLANGYYLIGQKGWDVAALSADLLFAANPENEGEFQLSVTLAKDDGVKVVKVENDAIAAWYPEGMGNEYKVDEAHAGEVTIYFRPEGNSDWADFGGFFYVATSAPVVERVVIGVNVPAEGLGDAGVKIFGTFAEEPLVLEKIIATGWYLHSNIPATADDSFSFCDAANADKVLCEKDGELWVKFTKKFSDLWVDDTYKDDPVKFVELDLSDADKYAWQTDYVTAISNTAVEAKAVKMIQNGQLFIIRDGKTYTVQGLQVK